MSKRDSQQSLTRIVSQRGRFTSTVTYGYNLSLLNTVTSKLNGANQHPAHRRTGMWTRREDFESSVTALARQLSAEHKLASDFASDGFNNDQFRNEARTSNLRVHTITGNAIKNDTTFESESSFSTRDLSPKLRHFINDYCRVLELLSEMLAEKVWSNNIPQRAYLKKGTRIRSFNEVIGIITDATTLTSIDGGFFSDFYDHLWNDYKHDRGTVDISASGWASNNTELTSHPKVYALQSSRFNEMPVAEFMDLAILKMDRLLDYIR